LAFLIGEISRQAILRDLHQLIGVEGEDPDQVSVDLCIESWLGRMESGAYPFLIR
jgi:hypothetical protein